MSIYDLVKSQLQNAVASAPYLDYYRRKYGVGSGPNFNGAITYQQQKAAYEAYQQQDQQSQAAALATAQRRNAEATGQGYTGQAPDLTDSFIQQAAQQQRLRQKVGVNRAGSFLAPGGF